jgi:hypothetical protein
MEQTITSFLLLIYIFKKFCCGSGVTAFASGSVLDPDWAKMLDPDSYWSQSE